MIKKEIITMNKITVSRKTIWKMLYFCCTLVILNVTGSIFYNDYSEKVVVVIGMIDSAVIGLIYYAKGKKLNLLLTTGIAEFVLPFFYVTVVSCFSALVIYNTPNMGDVTQSFLRAIQIASIFMIVYVAVKKIGRESLDVLLCAGCISYVTVVANWIMNGFMNGDWDTSCLESHGFIEATGLLFIYYCLSKSYAKRQKLVRCIFCAAILLLGGKRVAWVGIAWSLLVYFLFHKFREKKDRIIKVVMTIYFTITFAYLILIKNNYFSLILSYFGIADNMRLSFWNFFRDSYELSLTYLGRGIQYTDNRMVLSSTKNALRITNNVGIHNDILRTYIGWGCVPFLYYYYNFFVLNLNKIKSKFKNADIWLYFAIVSYSFVNYMVDYMITYIPFNMCMFTIGLLINMESVKQ